MNTLSRLSLRSSIIRPGRTLLTLLSVVIGVAAIVAVSISTRTARLAYKQMFSAVTGKADLEVTGNGKDGFAESLVEQLEALKTADGKPVVKAAIPMMYRPGLLSVPGNRRVKVYALGVDPERDKIIRDYKLIAGRELEGEGEMLADASFARSSGLQLDDSVRLTGGRHALQKFKIVGLVSPQQASALKYSGMVLLPLDVAQDAFGDEDNVDRIQLVLQPGVSVDQAMPLVRDVVPAELKVDSPSVNSAIMEETQLSSEEGLKLSGAFTVLLAVFIIFNTFLMNVGERKRQLSIMRAVGGTRLQIVGMIMRESLALGLIGSFIGMGLGYLGGLLLNIATSELMQTTLPSPPFSVTPFVFGLFVGMVISLVAASIPALLAAMVTPLEGMRAVVQSRSNNVVPWFVGAGLIMIVSSLTILILSILGKLHIDYASPAGIVLAFGAVLVMPAIMSPLAHLAAIPLAWFSPLEARLALKQLLRHHLRTSLTMGVLFVAGMTGVGMASSLLDNIENVRNWARVAIVGDYFVRATMPDTATGLAPDLPPEIGEELKKLPDVKKIETVSFVNANVGDQTAMVIARPYNSSTKPAFDLIAGDIDTLGAKLAAGEAVVGTVLAERMKIKLGDTLDLAGKNGIEKIRVAGITNDYFSGGLSIHLDRATAERVLGIYGVDGYILRVDHEHMAELQEPLDEICLKYGATAHSYADITDMIEAMMRGIDACLWALVFLGFVVASFGVVNTLTMNVLEQTREIGLLRIIGMTPKQVRRTVSMQAIILGIIGASPGIAFGVVNAWLINLAMGPSLGHPVKFQLHPFLLIFAWVGSMGIVMVAAFFPALRAVRINVVNALHYE